MNDVAAPSGAARLAVDIGGTFTDVVVERDGHRATAKVLTTPRAPERGVMAAIAVVLGDAGVTPGDIGIVIHGTTLATNALIERKGARTALIATAGHRDTLELAYEDRFSEYDVYIDKPVPLVPRHLRYTVPERVDARGRVLLALDERAVDALVPELERQGVGSLAVGFLHAYANPAHERRVGEILGARLPGVWITLASEVCPEVREYERFSTACANAYVQPLMAGYLGRLATMLKDAGIACPLFLMLSGGGLATLETAMRYPVRLVESGPAGGAMLASRIAEECDLSSVLSFDMGGTTAKICLIDGGRPRTSRSLEVARMYRFLKGSGLPLRVPVIEMVEIGAGGGSIATVDALRRIRVGPESAGAEPGPACYALGGTAPTVTDADVVLGRIDVDGFAGGTLKLHAGRANDALARAVGAPLELTGALAAFGVSEVVEENMANAARVHAIERGTALAGRTLVAFGGAAPLHAARIAEKLGIDRVIVPTAAGVGSAVGFLRAPVAYEVVRSRYMRLAEFDPAVANAVLAEMQAEARAVVAAGAPGATVVETRLADMRYVGQGHEIPVPLPVRPLADGDGALLATSFDERYRAQYGRTVAGVEVEILSWSLTVESEGAPPDRRATPPPRPGPPPIDRRPLFDPATTAHTDVPVYARDDLAPGSIVRGPAVIAEAQTTTVVSALFAARVDAFGHLVLERV